MNYTQLVATLANLVVTPVTDAKFLAALPDALDYANLRMCRDLDFLETRFSQPGPNLVPGGRNVTMASLSVPVIVLEQVNIITPAGVSAESGTRNPLTPQSRPYMDMMYPAHSVPTTPTVPVDFAMTNQQNIIVGPAPDAAYGTEFIGTIRPDVISADNANTWITDNLPDMFVAACMIRLSGYMKNYSGTSDDPQQPVSWESQYMKLLEGAAVEEARRKLQAASWSNQKPLAVSTPPRN